jgi:2-polyprenyl-6-methoxyphenol hydroxylase-like FAD-dependent oxidoreductase
MIGQREVIVVGAGPVGLSLALGLARSGVNVLVLEKETGTAEHSRAPAIWSKTQELLAELGVIDRFLAEGILVPRIELWDADRKRILLRLPIEELHDETAYARLLILPQSKTERLLYEAIRDTTEAEVRFGCEVVGLIQSPSGVEVRYRVQGEEKCVRGRFVAGCDGAHSTVREGIGATLAGITYRVQAALADIRIPGDRNFRFPRLTTRPNLAIAIRIDANLWRLILPFSGSGEQIPLEKRIGEAIRSLFPRVESDTVWKSEFRLHRRVSSNWVDGRIVLAGDAAHLNSPVGGEGMNAGIMDAAVLRKALVEGLDVDEGKPLLDYAMRRRLAIERGVNPFTDRLTRLLLTGNGRFIRPMFKGAQVILGIGPLRRRFLRRLAMLDQL